MKTPIYISILLFIIHLNLYSQESSIFSNYYLSPIIINPALTGSEYYPMAALSVKRQWVSIPNSPTTYLLTGNYRIGSYDFYDPKGFVNKGPLKLMDRIGIGGAIYKDQNGPSDYTGGILSYAYHLPIKKGTRLSFGMSIIGTYYSFNNSELKPNEPNDPYLFSGNENVFRANVNFGLSYYSDTYFAGLSSTKILPDVTNVNDKVLFQPSYYIIGGYHFLDKKMVSFEPSMTLKIMNNKNISADFYSKIYIKKYNWIALSYSTIGKLNFLFGIQLRKMLFAGYNYEYSLSKIANYNYGSHEIYLGINLGLRGSNFIRERSNNK